MTTLRKIVAVVSESQEPLRKIFETTLKDDIPLEIVTIQIEGNGDFRTPEWYEAIRQKLVVARNTIEENLGNIIVVADIDIQFFGKVRPLIESTFQDGCDICFQAEYTESDEINAGFIAISCNQATLKFYEELSKTDLTKYSLADQIWINQNIHSSGLRWKVFPTSIYAWSQCGPDIPRGILLHHANCTTGQNSLAQKLSQMEFVRQRVAAFETANAL